MKELTKETKSMELSPDRMTAVLGCTSFSLESRLVLPDDSFLIEKLESKLGISDSAPAVNPPHL